MPQSTIGTVYLNVANLDRLVTFYTDIIGMREQRRENGTVYLGTGGAPLLALTERPDYRRVPGSTGLYHFAILVPSRYDLARSLRHLADTATRIQGASDHLVSEALYLADPEGNGIEIYRDRPRSDWYDAQGHFIMGTEPLDTQGVLSALNGEIPEWTGLHADTIIGHIHLHVASLAESEAFYRDQLNLDTMMNLADYGAVFMSYEGYHHHVGANIWAGRNPAPPDNLGLDRFVLHLPEAAMLEAILDRFEASPPVPENGGYLIQDPSHNRILLSPPEA